MLRYFVGSYQREDSMIASGTSTESTILVCSAAYVSGGLTVVGIAPSLLNMSTYSRAPGVRIFSPATSSTPLIGLVLVAIWRKPFTQHFPNGYIPRSSS